ncbi:hypothetical protein QG044_05780 [Kingella kingae]|uniref:hypothetical protein n=1 Tax=Kingella kingae TaxID=504 RepID=UPI00042988D3|nr:hypothetical protein [Kingella kingae]MDK4586629.1 hypothetical protein [Kingella kingae]MDK4604662.1 hypothetical protein [Kingella kingae]MDK4614606.1 hypothetical protein [Kingella kingae]MDK4630822.1 hypothetical protein [Kingella kingae]MDK4648695.1 hypothetical protein [Kingella kingae]
MSFFKKLFQNPSENETMQAAFVPNAEPELTVAKHSYELTPHNPAMQQIFKDSLTHFSDCQAIACVDILTRQLVAMEASATLPDDVLALVASATTDVFTVPTMLQVAEIFRTNSGLQQERASFNEIIVTGNGTVYFLIRLPHHHHLVCVFSCNDDGNTFGMMLHEARAMIPQIEATL